MGFDVSYHPVDLEFIEERIVPAMRGKTDFTALVAEAVVLEKLRYRAKAWALGALLANQSAKKPALPTLSASLHVWGRPFFIGDATAEAVSATIDRYRASNGTAAIDALAKKNLAAFAPKSKAAIAPDMGAGLPSKTVLETAVIRDLNVLPEVFAAVEKKKATVRLPSGAEVPPEEIVRDSYPLLALAFMARFRPGWMDRGLVWPTLLMANAKLDWQKFFEPPVALFGSLAKSPRLAKVKLRPTIDQNFTVGGYVRKERVGALRAMLAKSEKALLAKPKKEKWEAEARESLQKIDEALFDAERRGLGFCEAAEVYSAPMGILN